MRSLQYEHTFGERVKVNLGAGGTIFNGRIVNIKFSESRVFYDIDVLVGIAEVKEKDQHTRIYNVDSAFVESTENVTLINTNKTGNNVGKYEHYATDDQSSPSVISAATCFCPECGKAMVSNLTTISSVCECGKVHENLLKIHANEDAKNYDSPYYTDGPEKGEQKCSDLLPNSDDEWISLKEYEKLIGEKLKDKPVIAQFINDKFPLNKWSKNIHDLVDKEMGAIREVRVKIGKPNTI